MAFVENCYAVTMPIGGAIAANIFVTVNGSGQVVAAAAGADAIGVTAEAVTTLQYDSGNGQVTVPVVINQGAKMKVKALATHAIAIGANIAAGTGGFAQTAASTNAILGVALSVAGVDADQEVITVLLSKAARLVP